MRETVKEVSRGRQVKKPVFITRNEIMEDLLHKIKLVAKTKATLLITGENGTGKEVMAGLLHYYSSRSDKEIRSEEGRVGEERKYGRGEEQEKEKSEDREDGGTERRRGVIGEWT